MYMTWKELKAEVERRLQEDKVIEDIPIAYIDIAYPSKERTGHAAIDVNSSDFELVITN